MTLLRIKRILRSISIRIYMEICNGNKYLVILNYFPYISLGVKWLRGYKSERIFCKTHIDIKKFLMPKCNYQNVKSCDEGTDFNSWTVWAKQVLFIIF